MRHPAKYTDSFIPIFADILNEYGAEKVLDPFAGTGKLASVKQYGFNGSVYANELEREWLEPNVYGCDSLTYCDAEALDYPLEFFDAICTSPTYGNRMADHHNAKDGSRRITYTHCLGRQLADGNTGKMQWGKAYRDKHAAIYKNIIPFLKVGGVFILNISNHIRKGEEIDVVSWHKEELEKNGLTLIEDKQIETPRMKQGANADKRPRTEHILLFEKKEGNKND